MRKVYVLMAAIAILAVGCKSNGGKKAAENTADPANAEECVKTEDEAKAEEVAARRAKVLEETISEDAAEEEVNVREAVEQLSAIEVSGLVESVAETLEKNPDFAIPFSAVETKPTFNGGDSNEFSKWVGSQIVYPQDAVDQKIQGKVLVQFTVSKEGDVKDVKVLNGVNELLDAEAVRVISSSPKWEPGAQNGVPAAVQYVFPVIFKIH